MRLAKRAQRRQQHFAGEKIIGGDADRTGQASPQCGSLTGQGACRDLDRGRRLSEFLSHLGQRVARLPAVEKLEAERRLQRIDTAGFNKETFIFHDPREGLPSAAFRVLLDAGGSGGNAVAHIHPESDEHFTMPAS